MTFTFEQIFEEELEVVRFRRRAIERGLLIELRGHPNAPFPDVAVLSENTSSTEATGQIQEERYNAYLTDGGHIKNLGIYELLRRRFKVIVAVDGEADPNMTFDSFVKLQILARIGLGVRIELPWKKVSRSALETSETYRTKEGCGRHKGPHGAIGIVHYSETEIGLIFYIKSSLSGDENDYIMDYKARHPTYPHETTIDQFFSEEHSRFIGLSDFMQHVGSFQAWMR